jgi:polyhydroxyalkanoate synthesis regulator phasin
MVNMMVNTKVLQAISQLVAQGKSVAMASVKAKVGSSASMREIIETLQAYKSNSDLIKDLPPEAQTLATQSATQSLTLRIETLEATVQAQAEQIDQLTERLNALES